MNMFACSQVSTNTFPLQRRRVRQSYKRVDWLLVYTINIHVKRDFRADLWVYLKRVRQTSDAAFSSKRTMLTAVQCTIVLFRIGKRHLTKACVAQCIPCYHHIPIPALSWACATPYIPQSLAAWCWFILAVLTVVDPTPDQTASRNRALESRYSHTTLQISQTIY